MDKISKNALTGTGKSTWKMLRLMMTVLFFTFGCDKYENLEYPINIPIIDYSLEKSGCFWAYIDENSLYAINSQQELLAILYCNNNCTPPSIDFSKYSLLVFEGYTEYTDNYVFDVYKNLQRLSLYDYQLNMEICLDEDVNGANTINPRMFKNECFIAILVPKLPQNVVVSLDVNSYQLCGNNQPKDLIFTTKFMSDVDWNLYNINDDTLYIINSQIELQNTIGFSGNVELDFTQHSVLFARGLAPNLIGRIAKKLQKLSEHNYKLNIRVGLMPPDVQEKWTVALIVQKMNVEDKIELNIIY